MENWQPSLTEQLSARPNCLLFSSFKIYPCTKFMRFRNTSIYGFEVSIIAKMSSRVASSLWLSPSRFTDQTYHNYRKTNLRLWNCEISGWAFTRVTSTTNDSSAMNQRNAKLKATFFPLCFCSVFFVDVAVFSLSLANMIREKIVEAQPDWFFPYFRALKYFNWRFWAILSKFNDGFGGSKIVKGSIGHLSLQPRDTVTAFRIFWLAWCQQ